jgi:hypothetical protein
MFNSRKKSPKRSKSSEKKMKKRKSKGKKSNKKGYSKRALSDYKKNSKRALKSGLGAKFSATVTGPKGTKVKRNYEIVRNSNAQIQRKMKGKALSIKRLT